MRRTTQNLVRALQAKGVKAIYQHGGGGCFFGEITLPNGRQVAFTDDVPDLVYDAEVTELAPGVSRHEWVRMAWKNYDGGFSLVAADGDTLFSGTIGGSHNLHAGFHWAEDMADEYIRICSALDPDFAPEPPRLPDDMQEALSKFLSAGYFLNELWNSYLNRGELEWLAGPDRYPHYLPSFDEFLLNFGAKLQGER